MPCESDDYDGSCEDSYHWENCVDTQRGEVGTFFSPANLDDLVWILSQAQSEGHQVRVVGSGWSFEDIAYSPDWMVDLRGLDATALPDVLAPPVLHPGRQPAQASMQLDRLAHVGAGITLQALHQQLQAEGFSLPTFPGAKGMTVAGAISTGTHGAEVEEGPLADLVQAIHLVTEGGQKVWIESTSAPVTGDDAILAALLPGTRIIRDDDLLNAVRVSLGRFGIIHSYVLRVTPMFRLAEYTENLSWEDVSAALATGASSPEDQRFSALEDLLSVPPTDLGVAVPADYHSLDIAFNPRNVARCWVRRKWKTDNLDDLGLTSHHPSFPCWVLAGPAILLVAAAALDLQAAWVSLIPFYGLIKGPEITVRSAELKIAATNLHISGGDALAMSINAIWASQVAGELVGIIDELNQIGMQDGFGASMGKGKRGPGWQISSGPPADGDVSQACEKQCSRGNAIEFTFSFNTASAMNFIDLIFEEIRAYPASGYVSLRFTRASQAMMSMHNVDHHTAAAVEVVLLRGTRGNAEFLRILASHGRRLGGRPHWGQQNDPRNWEVVQLYGIETLGWWRRQLRRIVGDSYSFSNDFTLQRGLEPMEITRQVTAVRESRGSISELCNPAQMWSPVTVDDAITEITAGIAQYFIIPPGTDGAPNPVVRYVDIKQDDTVSLESLPVTAGELPPPPGEAVSLEVTSIRRTGTDPITAICNEAEGWCVSVADAYIHIEAGAREYYVINGDGEPVLLRTYESGLDGSPVTQLSVRRFLTTAPDESVENNLDSLDDAPRSADDLPAPPASATSYAVTSVIRAPGSGDIQALCNADEGWCVDATEAFAQINAASHRYHVDDGLAIETREFLATRPDERRDNNLSTLPRC